MVDLLIRFRWWLFALMLALVAAAVPGVQRALVPDNSLTVWFLETDPALETYREFHKLFGNDEVALLMVEEPDGIFSPAALERLDRLEQRLGAIDGVALVFSILSVRDAVETAEGLAFAPLVPRPIPTDPALLAEARHRALDSQVFVDRLIDRDATRAMVWIQMQVMADIDRRRDGIVAAIYQTADEVLGPTEHALAGLGVIYAGLNQVTQADFGLFVSLGYLLMFGALWWYFRSVRMLLATLGVAAVGNIVALGVYGLLGHQMNMVTVLLPTLIIVLAVADAVHFPAIFSQVLADNPGLGRLEQVRLTLREVLVPCLLTNLNNMSGFLALALAPMAVIRDLGIFTAIGLGAALIAAAVLMTVAFFWFPAGARMPAHPIADRFQNTVLRLVLDHPGAMALGAIALTALGLFGAGRLRVDTYSLGYLPPDHRVVRDHQRIESTWGAYAQLDFLIEPQDEKLESAAVLNGMERFIRAASEVEGIRGGFSLASVYRRAAAVLGADKPASEPWRDDEVAQLGLLIGSNRLTFDRNAPGFRENVLAAFTTEDRAHGRLALTGRMASAKEIESTLARLQELGDQAFGRAARFVPAGYPPLYVHIIDYVMRSQVGSFLPALAFIFLLMLLWLRSFRLAVISLVPNVFPVAVVLGAMGFLGIDLDIASATVAAIVVGVSVDDTVHFLHHWTETEREGIPWRGAIEHIYRRAGRAAVTTTVLLVVGYPVLMLAGVKTVFYFGFLTVLSSATALYGDLVILPLMLRIWPGRAKAAEVDRAAAA